jgi:hypothetical protein
MKGVELYAQVRFAVQIEGMSRREAARRFGIDPPTLAKTLAFSLPTGYRRSRPPARPRLDPFTRSAGAVSRYEYVGFRLVRTEQPPSIVGRVLAPRVDGFRMTKLML